MAKKTIKGWVWPRRRDDSVNVVNCDFFMGLYSGLPANIAKNCMRAELTYDDGEPEKRYHCQKCGKLMSKDEGGTVFTICEICWDK